jgi:hypothetical protein
MRKLMVPLLVMGVLGVAFLIPTVGGADPDLANVTPLHSHWLVTGTGANTVYLGEVGPDACHNPNLQNAFNQFHNKVHRMTPSAIRPAAPALHNGEGGEIASPPCGFVPRPRP